MGRLGWLSILAKRNENVPEGGKLVGVKEITEAHWKTYGETSSPDTITKCVGSSACNKMVESLREKASKAKKGWTSTARTADKYTRGRL